MPKKSNLLNDLQIRRWIAASTPVSKSDGDGLTFTLSASGTAAWVLRYRLAGGRRREVTIGNYPDIGLAGAREKARALRAQIDAGIDPAAKKQEEKSRYASDWTVSELVDHYRKHVLTPGVYSPTTIQYREYDLNQVLLPRLGAWKVRSVTSIDIVSMLTDCKRTWTISKRILTTATKVFDTACGLMLIPANPCTGIKMDALFGRRPPVKSRTMLTTQDLRTLLRGGVDFIGRENALALLILLATCVRGVELVKARKEHLDLDAATWWVPDENVKTRSGFLVPLAPPVVDWFKELLVLSGESAFVLPARRKNRVALHGDTHVGRTTLWAAITRAFERGELDVTRFTVHDTRSTAKGHLRNMGISREISEIALNHKLKGMEGVYDVREDIPERRLALDQWAKFLMECANETPPSPKKLPRLRLVA